MTSDASETAFADTIPDALFEEVSEGRGGADSAAERVDSARGGARPFASIEAAAQPEFHELDFSALLPTRERRGPEMRQLRDPYGRRGDDRLSPVGLRHLATHWGTVQFLRSWGVAFCIVLLAIASLMTD